MKDIGTKIRLIFIPYLIISIATIGIYTFLHWFLFIKSTIFLVDEIVLNLAVPMILPWVGILIWLRPLLKLLELKKSVGGRDPLIGLMVISWICMIAPNVMAQEYLITATGKLTRLTDISQINKVPSTKYYMVKKSVVMKEQACKMSDLSVSGRHNQNLEMSLNIAVPVFYRYEIKDVFDVIRYDRKTGVYFFNDKLTPLPELGLLNPNVRSTLLTYKDSIADSKYNKVRNFYFKLPKQGTPIAYAWIAIEYRRTISNRLPKKEKDEQYASFIDEGYKDFDTLQVKNFVYLARIGQGLKLRAFKKTAEDDLYYNNHNSDNFFEPINEPFEQRNGHKLAWLFGSFAIGSLIFCLMLLAKPLKNNIPGIGYF